MKLIVGLGNPGDKYTNTRHNVGYVFIDLLSDKALPQGIVAKKTGVFMNDSGSAVRSLMDKYKVEATNLYVVHDDLDLKLGEYKIQEAKGPRLHKGLLSIEDVLGTEDFWRVRIGVDSRSVNNQVPGEEYVLEEFSDDEEKVLHETLIKAATNLLDTLS